MTRSGAVRTGANRTPEPYTGMVEDEKARHGNGAHLFKEQGVARPDEALPPRPDDAPDDDRMLRRLDATRKAAVAWLDRTGGRR